jgi:hypothetical protein
MERANPQNPLGAVLTDRRKREAFDGELRDLFPACHDHSPRLNQLLLQLQRNESGDQDEEQGACVLLAGS